MNIKYLDLRAINAPYEHAADEVLRSGWYLRGEATRRFEQHYAAYIGTRHCVGCGNGLDALTLMLRAYKELGRLRDGDEVVVPANTYIATILAITENRLVPVLVEPDLQTLQLDDTLVEEALTARTRAVMLVHLYGRCAYTDRIGDLCRRHGLLLLEDNAQAHGCCFNEELRMKNEEFAAAIPLGEGVPPSGEGMLPSGECLLPSGEGMAAANSSFFILHSSLKRTGSLGHAAAHSFYPTKNLGAFGDAGAVTTDDEELADMVRALGNYGSARHYVFDHLGRNSRMDELQAAILDAKLRDLDQMNDRRRAFARIYINKVYHPDITIPQCDRDSVYHIFPVLSARRDELQRYLAAHGVGTEIHYPIPPHRQRCYAGAAWAARPLPVTERIHCEELSIPCHPAMTLQEVSCVAELLNNF